MFIAFRITFAISVKMLFRSVLILLRNEFLLKLSYGFAKTKQVKMTLPISEIYRRVRFEKNAITTDDE